LSRSRDQQSEDHRSACCFSRNTISSHSPDRCGLHGTGNTHRWCSDIFETCANGGCRTSGKRVEGRHDSLPISTPSLPSDDAKDQDPAFTITRPADGTHLTSKVIAFGGSVADGSTVHRGKNEAKLQEGEWAMELVLSPGKNHVSFEAISDDGQTTTASVTVYFDAPKEDEKDRTDDSETSLTALQKYGSCGEEVPYDVFYGTAKPGVNITASSEYGSNSTTAINSGRWEMKVTFPDSPQGKTFDVKIRSSTGQYETFSFTNTGSGKDH
jgi:hypothetical protein